MVSLGGRLWIADLIMAARPQECAVVAARPRIEHGGVVAYLRHRPACDFERESASFAQVAVATAISLRACSVLTDPSRNIAGVPP